MTVPIRKFPVTRRTLLAGAGAITGSLLIGWRETGAAVTPMAESELATWLRIDPSGQVTVYCAAAEMGQGVMTALPMMVAEELGIDWTMVRSEMPASAPQFRTSRGRRITGNSDSVMHYFTPLRQAGAAAREMLIATAAARWHVPPGECMAVAGRVTHPATGNSAAYGELAADAALLPIPDSPALTAQDAWKILGKSVPRLDIPAKVDGTAVYGVDVTLPGMRTATLMASPVFGGRLQHVDPAPALACAGVSHVIPLESAVAVVADHYWNALQGLKALAPAWDLTEASEEDSAAIQLAQAEAALGEGLPGKVSGDTAGAFATADRTLDVSYQVPFLAHLCMEPMNATAHVINGHVHVWAPTQAETDTAAAVGAALGVGQERVIVHSTMMGGGFGRRAYTDFAVRAAQVASAIGGGPVQLLWSREEDVRHDFYRPAMNARFRGALNDDGRLVALEANVAGPSLIADFSLPKTLDPVINTMALSGDAYGIENLRLSYARRDTGIPVGIWRSTLLSQNGFFAESFIDEMAATAGRDPLAFRRELAAANAEAARTLDSLSAMFDFSERKERNRGWGLALTVGWNCICAAAIDLTLTGDKGIRINDVACAFHAGTVINPAIATSQVQGGFLYGLCAALWGDIEVRKGAVVAGNFDRQPVLRLNQAPAVRVTLLDSTAPPGGVGELSTSAAAPALANAIFRAGGERVRSLPVSTAGYRLAV
jgi:isoquinoline 1-oxidoreductase beta subunit